MTESSDKSEFDALRERELGLVSQRGDLFTRYFGLPLSLRISRFFINHGWSANTASVVMWLCGISGALSLSFGVNGMLVGCALLLFHHVMDYVDGQLARHHDTASIEGAVADRLNHFSVEAITYLTLGIGLYRMNPTIWSVLLPWVLFIWNRFRVLVDALAQLI